MRLFLASLTLMLFSGLVTTHVAVAQQQTPSSSPHTLALSSPSAAPAAAPGTGPTAATAPYTGQTTSATTNNSQPEPTAPAGSSDTVSPNAPSNASSNAPVQTTDATPMPHTTLPPMVTTASAEPDIITNLPASVRVITAADIKRSGATSITQVLERNSAVVMHRQPGNFVQTSIRGFRNNIDTSSTFNDQVLLLIDSNRAGTGNINNIPLANIERVEIIRGSGALLYGGSAVGGVVNVITKRGEGDISGNLKAEYGSFSTRNFQAGVSAGLFDDKAGFSAGFVSNNNAKYTTGEDSYYDNTQEHSAGGGVTATWRPSQHTSFSGVFIGNKLYDTGASGSYKNGSADNRIKNDYMYGSLAMKTQSDNGITLSTSLYANQNVYEYIDRDYKSDSTYDSRTLGGRAIVGIPLPDTEILDFGRLALGAEYARHTSEISGSAVYQPDSATDVYSLFAEHKFPVSSLLFQYGLRYDYYRAETKANSLDIEPDTASFKHLTLSGGATWHITDWLRLRSSASTAYVPPSARQLAGRYTMGGGGWSTTYVGNPNLKAEKSLTFDGGFGIEYEGLSLNAGYFHTRYKDRITWPINPQTGFYEFTNEGLQHMAGFEGDIRYTYDLELGTKALTISPYANWEYLTERHNKNADALTEEPYNVPKSKLTAGLDLGYGIFSLGLSATTIGKYTGTEWNNTLYVNEDVSVPSVTLYNARFTVTPYENLSVYVDMRNMTDKYYQYMVGSPQPGRSIITGISYEF